MVIREFTLEDYDNVCYIWQTQGIMLGPSESREEIERRLKHDPDLFLVAGQGKGIVGVVMGAWDGKRGWIYNQAGDLRFRRMGIGSQLEQEIENRLRGRGAKEIALLVDTGNLEGVDFYERCGFKQEGNQLLMVKTI